VIASESRSIGIRSAEYILSTIIDDLIIKDIKKLTWRITMEITNPSSLYCELIFLAGSEGRITFTKPHIRIGRQPDNDFVTPDVGTSRIHAEIVWDNGVWKIRSLNPANKITVNKQDIQQDAEIHHFDEIGLGRSSQTLIRFLACPHRGDTPDPKMDTTVHMQRPPLGGTLLEADKKDDDELRDPSRNSQDSVWQLVGIILAAISAIITVYALSPAMFVPGIITILIGALLCIGVVILSRKRPVSFS
jgi:pSer/pThr/pTyr-binding forkhead associated (FHA) protein